MKTAIYFSFAAALIACAPDQRDGSGDDGAGDDGDMLPGQPKQCNQMDIVFVVDDSGSMGEEQDNLSDNFPMFADLLSGYTTKDGDKIDFRVAVTTTGRDLHWTVMIPNPIPGGSPTIPIVNDKQGPDGAFETGCSAPQPWITPSDANFQQALSCRAKVGTSGTDEEMPLLMTKWALDERVKDGKNAGFLRPDALLAIVMLTDEDDSSMTTNNFVVDPFNGQGYPIDYHPPDHVQFLDTLKGHRSRWAAGVIAGDGACQSRFGKAANAERLKEFVELANGQGTTQAVFSSICDGDLTIGLKKALDTFQAACGGIIL